VGDDVKSLPLGVLGDEEYCEQRLVLAPGASIIMFSDGLTDASNQHSKLWGLGRLLDLIGKEASDLKTLGPRIVEGVQEFVGERPQTDDICLVCLSRL
jgi:sigma-B regulation protein RsbU (phosphoserine phosphatase)